MAIPYRREKLASQIVKDVSAILQFELKDPRMGFVSVTRVKLTPDLAQARVYVSVLGKEKDKKLTLSALRHARGFVQRALAKRLSVRQCPEIEFERDDSIEKTVGLTKKIDELARERERRAGPEGAEPRSEEE